MGYVKLSQDSFSSLIIYLQFVSQIPPYFANTQGASDTAGGARTIPSSIGNAVGNLLAGQVIKKYPLYDSPVYLTSLTEYTLDLEVTKDFL
jgi:hypothetical protein